MITFCFLIKFSDIKNYKLISTINRIEELKFFFLQNIQILNEIYLIESFIRRRHRFFVEKVLEFYRSITLSVTTIKFKLGGGLKDFKYLLKFKYALITFIHVFTLVFLIFF